jgi:hypothetical protein
MKLKTLILTLESDGPIKEDASKLRGFFATRFNEYILLHQHNADKFIYKYPLVQYKIVDGKPMVLGINEGVDVLKEIYDKFEEIPLGQNKYKIMEKRISIKNQEFSLANKFYMYQFVSPWFALSQENYRRYYLAGGREERQDLLNQTLIGNLLSMSKSLRYFVPEKIRANVVVKPKKARLKDTNIMAFIGTFQVNFNLPDFIGIGKSVSRGFGVVKRCSS